MLGTPLEEAWFIERGVVGDRAWALRDVQTGRIASAKKFPRLLEFRASYDVTASRAQAGRVQIQLPSGETVAADDPRASQMISDILGHQLRLENQPREDEKTTIDKDTVFGGVPANKMMPEWTPETMPDYFQLRKNSFMEIGPVFLLTTGSIEYLRKLQGGAASIDRRRFRPNLLIDTNADTGRFIEDDWLDASLSIGESLVVADLKPTVWCVTSTLAQEELPRDQSILRTIAQENGGCLGVYASIRSPGTVRVGDRVERL
jgi:uncharacterized protein